MKQFNLNEWLKDKSRKVVTRDGRPVRILCTDAKAKDGCCIIAAIETDGEEEGYQFFKNGKAYSSKSSIEDCADLFFADEEEELTEFEKDVEDLMDTCCNEIGETTVTDDWVRERAARLLVLARKEIKNNDWRQSLKSYKNAYEQGKQDALKDLPEWKKITEEKQNYLAYGYLSHDGYYLNLQELREKLPKEE